MGNKAFFDKYPEARQKLREKVVEADGVKRLIESREAVARYVGCAVRTLVKEMKNQGIVSEHHNDNSFRWDEKTRIKFKDFWTGSDENKSLKHSIDSVALSIGCSIPTLIREMKRQGIRAKGFNWNDVMNLKFSQMWEERNGVKKLKYKLEYVAYFVGCSISNLEKKLDQEGIMANGPQAFQRRPRSCTALQNLEDKEPSQEVQLDKDPTEDREV